MEICFVMCCMWGSCELAERCHHSWKVTVDFVSVMKQLTLMWSQIQLPFFALGLWVCSWKTKHICKQILCNVGGEKGNLEATADVFPWAWKAQMLLAEVMDNLPHPLLSREIPADGFLWNTKGIDSLVLPLCCAALLHPKGKIKFLRTGFVMQWHPAGTMWMVQSLLRSKTLSNADFRGKPWLGSSVEGGGGHSFTRRWEREVITMVYSGR